MEVLMKKYLWRLLLVIIFIIAIILLDYIIVRNINIGEREYENKILSTNYSKSTKYKMDIILKDEIKPQLEITLSVNIINDSDTIWNEIYFRNFMDTVNNAAQGRTDAKLNLKSSIKNAEIDGKKMKVKTDIEDASIIIIELDVPIKQGETKEITLEYETDLPEGGFRCAYHSFSDEYEKYRTYELAQFYPMLAIFENGKWIKNEYIFEGETMYTRIADYDITAYIPEKYEVIASRNRNKGKNTRAE